jgi:Flp pilus assembly protein TadG
MNIIRKANRGQGLLELALVLPFLLVIVFGVFDLGRIFFTTITLVSASREGARFLSVYPEDVSNTYQPYWDTKRVAYNEARNSGIDLELNEINPMCEHTEDPDVCDSGKPATVTVTTDFDLVLGWLLPSPITITRSAQMIVP